MSATKSKKTPKKKLDKYTYAYGRRKGSIATARVFEGKGEDLINDKKVKEVYDKPRFRKSLYLPFEVTETDGKYHFTIKVKGGGISGQLDAMKLALARALEKIDTDYRDPLKKKKLLTVDSRVKERKKPGLKKARKKEQFSKR